MAPETISYLCVLEKSCKNLLTTELKKVLSSWGTHWLNNNNIELETVFAATQLFESQKARGEAPYVLGTNDFFEMTSTESESLLFAKSALELDYTTELNSSDKSLLEVVNKEMIESLSHRLMSVIGISSDYALKIRNGFVGSCFSISARIGSSKFNVCLSPLYVHKFVLLSAKKNKEVISAPNLLDRFDKHSIEYRARIAVQQITISQFKALKVGHVVTLNQPLDAPISVTSKQNDVVLKGFLVRKKDHKAIYLSGNKK